MSHYQSISLQSEDIVKQIADFGDLVYQRQSAFQQNEENAGDAGRFAAEYARLLDEMQGSYEEYVKLMADCKNRKQANDEMLRNIYQTEIAPGDIAAQYNAVLETCKRNNPDFEEPGKSKEMAKFLEKIGRRSQIKKRKQSKNNSNGDDDDDDDDDVELEREEVNVKCPITQTYLVRPMRNNACSHVYSEGAILALLNGGHGRAKCPQIGCVHFVTPSQLVRDEILERRVRRAEIAEKTNPSQKKKARVMQEEDLTKN
jgi:hypothetical protein